MISSTKQEPLQHGLLCSPQKYSQFCAFLRTMYKISNNIIQLVLHFGSLKQQFIHILFKHITINIPVKLVKKSSPFLIKSFFLLLKQIKLTNRNIHRLQNDFIPYWCYVHLHLTRVIFLLSQLRVGLVESRLNHHLIEN